MTNQIRLTHNFVLETNGQLRRKIYRIYEEGKVSLVKIFQNIFLHKSLNSADSKSFQP